MAITYVGTGTTVYSTGNPSPGAAANAIGDLLILIVGTKPDSTPATTPSGWTLLGSASGGTGSQGIDTGPMRVGVFYKVATSANEAPGAITITGNNVSAASVYAFRPGAGNIIDIVGTGAADTTTGTPHSATMPVNPGLTVGDALLAVGIIPTDVTTPSQFSAQTVSATGMTTVNLTEIEEWDTASGQDMGGWVARGSVVTGTATAAPTVSATAGGTTTNVAGPIFLVRMRELPAQESKPVSDSGTISVTEGISIAAITSKSGSDTGTISVTDSINVAPFSAPSEPTVIWSGTSSTLLDTSNFISTGATNAAIDDLVVVYATANTNTQAGWTGAGFSSNVTQLGASGTGATRYFYGKVTSAGQVSATPVIEQSEYNLVSMYVIRGADLDVAPHMNGNIVGEADFSLYTASTQWGNAIELVFSLDSGGASAIETSLGAVETAVTTGQPLSAESYSTSYFTSRGSSSGTNYTVFLEDYLFGITILTGLEIKGSGGEGPTTKEASDSGTISATESASVVVFASVSASDTGTLSASAETLTVSGTTTAADSGTLSATESTQVAITSALSDTGNVSATESIQIAVVLNATDSGTVSATDEASTSPLAASNVTVHTPPTFTSIASSNTSWVANGPSTVAEGDLLVAFVVADDTQTVIFGSATGQPTAPSGWNVRNSGVARTAGGDVSGYLYTKVAGAGDVATGTPNTYTWSWPISTVGSITIVRLSNVDGTTPVVDSTLALTPAASTSVAIPAVTTTAANSMLLTFVAVDESSATYDPYWAEPMASGFTSLIGTSGTFSGRGGSDTYVGAAYKEQAVAGSSGTVTVNTAAENDAIVGYLLAVSPAAASHTPKSGDDSGTVSSTESTSLSITATQSLSDGGSVNATETMTVFSAQTLSDTGALSANELSQSAVSSSRTDTGTISAVESISVASVLATTDSGSFSSSSETSLIVVTVAATESGTVSASDSSTVFKNVALADSGTVSATESASMVKFLGLSDTGTLSVTETAQAVGTVALSDSATVSATEQSTVTIPYQSLAVTDSGIMSASENASVAKTQAITESGTLSAVDSATMVKSITLSDSGTLSSVEALGFNKDVAGNDTGIVSATDSASLFVSNALSTTDTGTVSATETASSSGTTNATDTGTFVGTDSATIFKSIALSDTGTVSATDTLTIFSARPGADSGILSVTENASVDIFGTVTKEAIDAGSLSSLDQSTSDLRSSLSDTGEFSAEEALGSYGTVGAADSGTVSAMDDSEMVKSASGSDAGSISATETASVLAFTGFSVQVWDGTAFVTGVMHVWDGTQFVSPNVNVWDGDEFVSL